MNKFSITVTTRFTRGAERRLLEIFFFFLVEVLLKRSWKLSRVGRLEKFSV